MPCLPGLLQPEPLSPHQAAADPCLHRRHSSTQSQSGSVSVQSLGLGMHISEHLWQVWILILNAISPLMPSCWGFSSAFGCVVSFFSEIQHFPVDSCSAVSCNFGVLAGEDVKYIHLLLVHFKFLKFSICYIYPI